MVDGNLELVITDGFLSESARSVNFNPAGTPWQGETDSDQGDDYPSRIAGIVYTNGNLVLDGGNKSDAALINGAVVCDGNLIVQKSCVASVDLDPIPASNPPPGFGASSSGQLQLGTWHRVPTP